MANSTDKNKILRTPKKKYSAKKKAVHPKWHDLSCEEAHRKVSNSAKLFKANPKDQSLGARLRRDIKDYRKLVKLRNKQFVNNMFMELDSMENSNPRGYMNLIKAMRDGSFDKATSDDTSSISPTKWHDHFSSLLAKMLKKMNIWKDIFWKIVIKILMN